MSIVCGALGVTIAILVAAWMVGRTPDGATGDLAVSGAPTVALGDSLIYEIPAGHSASEIGDELQELGIVQSARQFRLLVSLMGLEDRLSAGDYQLPTGASVVTVINLLTSNRTVPTIRVTFPEGLRIEEMAELAEEAGFGPSEDFIAAAHVAVLPAEFAADAPEGHDRQGYLFPDTYIMPQGVTAADLVEFMIETLDRRFSPELRDAVRAQGLTLHEALTIASIIEREAVLEDERPLIAGVFFNRIAAGDRLGADPTVQFAVAIDPFSVAEHGWWKAELTVEDLEIDSEYNTRKYSGIPPGPITNPGLAAIEAVANPSATTMYYFVADSVEGDGSHLFAETWEQHLANIASVGQ